jgi:ribosomal protein S18 acetylase RimI-like enzyme
MTAAPPHVTVRRVRPSDAARVRALRLEMLADSPLAFLESLADAAARPHAEFAALIAGTSVGHLQARFIAERDGRLIGHAGGISWPEDSRTTVVFAVYITPEDRGSGVLEMLVDAVAAWSRAAGRPRLLLEIVTGNDRALRAYRRLGFELSGERVPHPTVPVLTEDRLYRPA